MTEEIQRLWAVHELDDRAAKLTDALRRFPTERAEAEARLASEKLQMDRLRERVSVVQKERRALEQQVESVDAEEIKFKNQLPQVKKNEEYQALVHEIQGCEAKRSAIETQILEKLEEEEGLNAEAPLLQTRLDRVASEVNERVAKIDAAEGVDRAAVAEIDKERAFELEGVERVTRSRYERIRASRQGRAVVAIINNACGGCFRNQPPQSLQEARRGDRLVSCDGCGRMLILPPDQN